MKKKLIIGLSALGLTLATAGATYAFLTDSDDAGNVFTIGNVDIVLNDVLENEVVKLMPNNTEKAKTDYTITLSEDSDDAYVWLRLKIPAALEAEAAKDNIVHWNLPGRYWNGYHENTSYWEEGQTEAVDESKTWIMPEDPTVVTIEGIEYNVYDILYKGPITAGETTNIGISSIYMDERVDKVGGEWYLVNAGVTTPIDFNFDNGATVIVEGHAIQANGFKTVQEAYEAYNEQWPEGRPVPEK